MNPSGPGLLFSLSSLIAFSTSSCVTGSSNNVLCDSFNRGSSKSQKKALASCILNVFVSEYNFLRCVLNFCTILIGLLEMLLLAILSCIGLYVLLTELSDLARSEPDLFAFL